MIQVGYVTVLMSFQMDTEYEVKIEREPSLLLAMGDILEGEDPPRQWRIEGFAFVRWIEPADILTKSLITVIPLTGTAPPPNGLRAKVLRSEKHE